MSELVRSKEQRDYVASRLKATDESKPYAINHILEEGVVIKSVKDLTKRTYPPTQLPANKKLFQFLLPRAKWDHGGIYHQDKQVDRVMANAPSFLEVYPIEMTKYRGRHHKFWNKCMRRYINYRRDVDYKQEMTRKSREFAKNGWLWGNTMQRLKRKARFAHGGVYHQDQTVNDLMSGWPHIVSEVLTIAYNGAIPPIVYERPSQRFWLFLYFKFDKLIHWWYK